MVISGLELRHSNRSRAMLAQGPAVRQPLFSFDILRLGPAHTVPAGAWQQLPPPPAASKAPRIQACSDLVRHGAVTAIPQ